MVTTILDGIQRIKAAKAALNGRLKPFIPYRQSIRLIDTLMGKKAQEAATTAGLLLDLAHHIEAMPSICETESEYGELDIYEAIVFLHYSNESANVWLFEKDIGDDSRDDRQLQAFGLTSSEGPELEDFGYICLRENRQSNFELDLRWEPKQFRKSTNQRRPGLTRQHEVQWKSETWNTTRSG